MRFINFNVKFNIEDWAKWAEESEIDGRAINFALYYGNEIFKKHNNVQTVNDFHSSLHKHTVCQIVISKALYP